MDRKEAEQMPEEGAERRRRLEAIRRGATTANAGRSYLQPLQAYSMTGGSFARLLKRAGLPGKTRFHDLRHTCAMVLLSEGVNPKFVQELLGHADIKMTLGTYSHFLPSMGNQTANAMEKALS